MAEINFIRQNNIYNNEKKEKENISSLVLKKGKKDNLSILLNNFQKEIDNSQMGKKRKESQKKIYYN